MNKCTRKNYFSTLQQSLTFNKVEISQDMKSIFEDPIIICYLDLKIFK